MLKKTEFMSTDQSESTR